MKYYDFSFQEGIVEGLGFEHVYALGKDISCGPSSKERYSIIYGKGNTLGYFEKTARAVVPIDFEIGNALLAKLREHNTAICLPISKLLEASGLEQQYLLHTASVLASKAIKNRVRLSIASFAQSKEYACSPIQLISMA
ncbi:MAG: hypothetical protein QXL94_08340, partial [Candidatus Parvarchaeum sp.]